MKFEKNKKGSHVGLVLSFTLFVTFLLFIYIMITPSVKTFDNDLEVLESFKSEVLESISDEVVIIRVYDEVGGGAQIDHSGIELTNVVAFDYEGNEIPATASGDTTEFESPGDFAILYYHENFVQTEGPSAGGPQIEIGNILIEDRILETKILELLDLIKENYSLARQTLDLVGDNEFDVQFKYEDGTWIKPFGEVEHKKSIYSKQFGVDYLSVDAREEAGEIIVRIW